MSMNRLFYVLLAQICTLNRIFDEHFVKELVHRKIKIK